jgi:hypothetical protein
MRGWRRKIGCATLVMALVLIGIWIRSNFQTDIAHLGGGSFVVSGDGHFTHGRAFGTGLTTEEFVKREFVNNWYHAFVGRMDAGVSDTTRRWRSEEHGDTAGIEYGCHDLLLNDFLILCSIEWSRVPYWELVAPLMLFSAYLILWKPRKLTNQSPFPNP